MGTYMPVISVSDAVYRLIQENAIPLEDTANSALERLLGFSTDSATSAVPTQRKEPIPESGNPVPETSATDDQEPRHRRYRKPGTDGALKPLLDAGYVAAGDKLVWKQRKKGVTHRATIEANGWIVLKDGESYDTPSGAAAAACGRRQPGWGVWKHSRTKKTLLELKARQTKGEPATGARKPVRDTSWHSKLRTLLDELPEGRWTTFTDLGTVLEVHRVSIVRYLEQEPHPRGNLIFKDTGEPSPSVLRDSADPYKVLTETGIKLDGDMRAQRDQRIPLDRLSELVEPEPAQVTEHSSAEAGENGADTAARQDLEERGVTDERPETPISPAAVFVSAGSNDK
ncbi:restriction system modified-DNA reader domain-containing protein [Salininema proteolyticum]|uniref:RAMA domain-containing protein n=1 Tax=Salininema proteolyticum TaxID=1607685 RepID=A0ABV8U2B1_9ACTN